MATPDPLADLIERIVDDDMWERRGRRLFIKRITSAIQSYIATNYVSRQVLEECLDVEYGDWRGREVITHLRDHLLGKREEKNG